MKLGLLTAAFPELTLDEIADWASANGFETVSYTHLTLPTTPYV